MTWTPTEQGPCRCKFCAGEPVSYPEAAPVIVAPEPRTCTEADPCGFCGPVAQWIERTDPAPVEAPPEPGHEKTRPLKREPGGVSDQPTAPVIHLSAATPAETIRYLYGRIVNAREDRT